MGVRDCLGGRVIRAHASAHGTADMRVKPGDTKRARPPRRARADVRSTVRHAMPAALSGLSIGAAAIIVLALYRLVTGHGVAVASLYFHSDMAGLDGATTAACGALALMIHRNRALADDVERLELRLEDFSDRAWEIKEAEERAKSFLEAQGDMVMGRDGRGR